LILTAFVDSANMALAAKKVATDPTGTWKIARGNPETKTKGSERTLKLKLEGGKLTGTIDGQSNINGKVRIFEWPIKNTKIQGNDFSFTVSHPPVEGKGPNSTSTYEGKIAGDTMKGRVEVEFAGQTFTRKFERKRVKE
jgi:hypothetical protein